MRKLSVAMLIVGLFFTTTLSANYSQNRRVLTSAKILKDALKAPKTGITNKLLHDAKAIAIFPNTLKTALFLGARVGKGILSVKDSENGWSDPIFVDLKGFSLGAQFGFKATDLIVIFKTDRSLDSIESGKITIGIDAGVVFIAKGAQNGRETDEKLAADIKNFGKSSGAYIGIGVSGATLGVNNNDDFDYYDDLVYVGDILAHDKIKNRPETEKLLKVLNSF